LATVSKKEELVVALIPSTALRDAASKIIKTRQKEAPKVDRSAGELWARASAARQQRLLNEHPAFEPFKRSFQEAVIDLDTLSIAWLFGDAGQAALATFFADDTFHIADRVRLRLLLRRGPNQLDNKLANLQHEPLRELTTANMDLWSNEDLVRVLCGEVQVPGVTFYNTNDATYQMVMLQTRALGLRGSDLISASKKAGPAVVDQPDVRSAVHTTFQRFNLAVDFQTKIIALQGAFKVTRKRRHDSQDDSGSQDDSQDHDVDNNDDIADAAAGDNQRMPRQRRRLLDGRGDDEVAPANAAVLPGARAPAQPAVAAPAAPARARAGAAAAAAAAAGADVPAAAADVPAGRRRPHRPPPDMQDAEPPAPPPPPPPPPRREMVPVPAASLRDLHDSAVRSMDIVVVPQGAPQAFQRDWLSRQLVWPDHVPAPALALGMSVLVHNVGTFTVLRRYAVPCSDIGAVVSAVEDIDVVPGLEVAAYPTRLGPVFRAQESALENRRNEYDLVPIRNSSTTSPLPMILPTTVAVHRIASALRSLHSDRDALGDLDDGGLNFIYASFACDQEGETTIEAMRLWSERYLVPGADVVCDDAPTLQCPNCEKTPCILLAVRGHMIELDAALQRRRTRAIIHDARLTTPQERRFAVYRNYAESSNGNAVQLPVCIPLAARLLYSGGELEQAVGFRNQRTRN